MNPALTLLQKNFSACRQRSEKLHYSLEKSAHLFPLTASIVVDLTDEEEESIDALILRYSQLVSMIQDHLFRGIAVVEQEDISQKSNRDKALLMEKIGAIHSADAFGSAALLRNKFSHHYPEDIEQQVERLNLVVEQAHFVIQLFAEISYFLEQKGWISSSVAPSSSG